MLHLLLNFLAFDDAERVMREGVFTITSVAGYSISKSIFFYAAFLVAAVAISFLLVYFFKQFFSSLTPQNTSQDPLVLPGLKIKEYVFLIVIILLVASANIFLREKTFGTYTYYTEEFYNLAAINELQQESFSIIYPYSVGNLMIGSILQGLSINLIYYKIFLNALAIVAIYFCLAAFIPRIRYRLLIFTWLMSLFFWSLIGPTLHANVLRLFMPVISVIFLFHFVNKYRELWQRKLIAISALFAAVLFFGAADSIAVFLVLYALFFLYQLLNGSLIKEKLIFIFSPLLAVVTMFVVFGVNYVNIFVNQVRSISFYSGHPNAAPYYNLFAIFGSSGIGEAVKSCLYTLIFYLPFVIMAGLIFYTTLLWQKKENRFQDQFVSIVLLLFTFLLYYRQNFGNAGPGRVVAASTVLLFVLLAIKKYYQPDRIKNAIFIISIAFFSICTLVGFYFLRYSLIYLYDAYQNRSVAIGLASCADTAFGKELVFAGFTHCDKSLVEELKEIKVLVKDRSFYVYDDTFGLYYILGARPITLMPSLYMAYTKESIIVEKLKDRAIEFIVYPRDNHFFGVPKEYLKDPRFMKVINDYRTNNFKKIFTSPRFEVYQITK